MKQETKNSIKSDVLTGMSSSVGTTIGMVAGSAITTEMKAEVVIPEPDEPAVTEPVEPAVTEPCENDQVVVQEADPSKPIETGLDNCSSEPDLLVLGYETVTGENGEQADLALVSMEGQEMVIADVDMDGEADLVASDLNGDGTLSNDEFMDVSGQGLAMATFQDYTMMEDGHALMAQNEDYINNADVDEYMA